jgi:uncharacterized lipoprotein NlpE involved in copper resistance
MSRLHKMVFSSCGSRLTSERGRNSSAVLAEYSYSTTFSDTASMSDQDGLDLTQEFNDSAP